MKNNVVWKIIKNKYVITILVFLAVILFFDENNLFVIHSLHKEVADLEHVQDTLRKGISQDSVRVEWLETDLDSIERYGRECYYMKRENEDVFIVSR